MFTALLIVLTYHYQVVYLLPSYNHQFRWLSNITDRFLTIEKLIESRGYQCEQHRTLTMDGYILTLHRVINPRLANTIKPAVILQHGTLDSSITWLLTDDNNYQSNSTRYGTVGNSLGFELAKRGYDVWLGNFRGNTYSNSHVSKSLKSVDYWKFSFDQLIAHDLPAMFNCVLKTTQQRRLAYVGHSLGATAIIALLSETKKWNRIVRPVLMLAPNPYFNNTGSSLAETPLASVLISFLVKNPSPVFQHNTFYDVSIFQTDDEPH